MCMQLDFYYPKGVRIIIQQIIYNIYGIKTKMHSFTFIYSVYLVYACNILYHFVYSRDGTVGRLTKKL